MEEEQDIDKKESLYKITYSSQFKKDYKKFENNKKKIAKIENDSKILKALTKYCLFSSEI